ncbi:MAG: glycosyltransferase family 9 protein [Fibrobacter sp.]|nr:glycosyltransferase family 9 protein [Fibrobacter sp.]
MRTIVYHSGALGDFISVVPVLRLWRMHTASPIDIITRAAHYRLTNYFKITDKGIDTDSSVVAKLFVENGTEIASFTRTYTHAILFASESSQIVKNFKSYFRGELYYHDPHPDRVLHCTDYQLSIIDPVRSMYSSDFSIPCISFKKERPIHANRICIHTGSGSVLKNWDFNKYLGLADLLRSQGHLICWIRGYAEKSDIYPSGDSVYTIDSLIDLSMHLNDSLLFIGNDSGLSHLAAACGCKVVALFGPSDPAVWAPKGTGDIRVVYNRKNCSPCHLRNSTKNKDCHRECLKSISIDTVAVICMRLISNV